MNHGFRAVLAAPSADRRDLFVTAGNRLGTVEQNVEKDLWAWVPCWVARWATWT